MLDPKEKEEVWWFLNRQESDPAVREFLDELKNSTEEAVFNGQIAWGGPKVTIRVKLKDRVVELLVDLRAKVMVRVIQKYSKE